MNRIAIVTPNSDTFTNPTMTTFFHLLKEKGVDVILFGPEQQPVCPDNIVNVTCVKSTFYLFLLRNPRKYSAHFKSLINVVKTLYKYRITNLFAVDPLGIIIGGRIKRILGKKLNLNFLSFEIFFRDELSTYYLKLKKKEVFYSKYIDSLLIQDKKRKQLIFAENNIQLAENQIAYVPVSPAKIELSAKPDLHKKFNVVAGRKLVVYSGSVGEWCGTKAIIEAFDKGYWTNDFHLVFHTRKPVYADSEFYDDLIRMDQQAEIPFSLHPHPFESFEDLSFFLSGFDLALALYYPNHQNPYYGMNMKEIGLSSGKFATYMMLGLPTLVTSCSVYNDLLVKYKFGDTIDDISQISQKLTAISKQENQTLDLFSDILDPVNNLKIYINDVIKL